MKAIAILLLCASALAAAEVPANFAPGRLVAWCIVPFDAKKRGPRERAEMLERLGIQRLAYDWRGQHVPTFEEEILALKEKGIEFFAFWGRHEGMFQLFAKHGLAPQVWQTLGSPRAESQEKRVEAAAKGLLPLVERTRKMGCKLGLYNHGGWGGEPANLAAVCAWLRKNADAGHVGIVYNFHHAHNHIGDFTQAMAAMKPYLLCLNLNGMNPGAKPKILPIGEGKHEKAMIEAVIASGYDGPIGIIGHDASVDVGVRLKKNLDGLAKLLAE
jgi:sugar phosphate isomerase/epimerase